tara:strand:+ start:21870 stop:22823 length:954 start_codon:yes stop_codon:yes gene_type:complete
MILITGGTGFLGSNILFSLAKEKKIISLYRSQSKIDLVKKFFKKKSTKGQIFFKNIIWKKCDILNFSELDDVFKQVNYVIHCAGLVSFFDYDKKKLNEINLTGTSNIVNLSIKHKIKKMIFVSSIAALTNDNLNKYSTNENDKELNSYYGFTKKMAELEIWRASQEGIYVNIVSPGVILGDGVNNKLYKSIYKYTRKKILFYTDGILSIVKIEDVVNSIVKLLNSNIKNQKIILVSKNVKFLDFLYFSTKKNNYKQYYLKLPKYIFIILIALEKFSSVLLFRKSILSYNLLNSLFNDYEVKGTDISKKLKLKYSKKF